MNKVAYNSFGRSIAIKPGALAIGLVFEYPYYDRCSHQPIVYLGNKYNNTQFNWSQFNWSTFPIRNTLFDNTKLFAFIKIDKLLTLSQSESELLYPEYFL